MVNSADQTNEEKFVPMVYQLSNAGIDVNGQDYKGRTALELAIMRELMELMVALLRIGIDPNEQDYKAKIREFGSPLEYELINTLEKYEPGLWGAVKRNDASMVHMMVNSWCRINIRKGRKTLMQIVQENGDMEEIYNTLDDYEVTIEFVHATLAGDEKRMLEFLMDSKPCDPYIMDISYQERWSKPLQPRSLRQTAIAMGHQHVLHLLPEDDDDDLVTGQVHNHKVCSATVIGNTSMLDDDYVPFDKVSRTNGSTLGAEDSVQYGNSWNFVNGKRTGLKKSFHAPKKKHTSADDYKTGEKQTKGEDIEQPTSGQYEECIVKLSGVEEKCFYFHEVDNFVEQCEPEAFSDGRQHSISTRGKASDITRRDYSHNWENVTVKQSKTKTRSKMCVIS